LRVTVVQSSYCYWIEYTHQHGISRHGSLQSITTSNLVVPRCRLSTYGTRAFTVAGPVCWNALLDYLKSADLSVDCFKHELKKFYQRCKRDLFFRDRDETKTFESLFESLFETRRDRDLSRPRPRRFSRCRKWYSLLSFWLQTATNYAVFRSFITQKHSSVSATVLQKLLRHFPKDCQQFKKLLYRPTLMHYVLTI